MRVAVGQRPNFWDTATTFLFFLLVLIDQNNVWAIHPHRSDVASTNNLPASHISRSDKEKKTKKKKVLPPEMDDTVLQPTKKHEKKKPAIPSANNKRSATMIRLQREWKDVVQAGMGFDWVEGRPIGTKPQQQSNNTHIVLGPLSKSHVLVWHFSFTGVPGSPYEHGVYHGRIVLPKNYPAAPPRISLWTESGRFLPKHDICLDASHYHPETWQPAAWTVRTIVESVRLHMLNSANEIGGVTRSLQERVQWADKSRQYRTNVSVARRTAWVDHARMLREGWIGSGNDKTMQESNLSVRLNLDEMDLQDRESQTTTEIAAAAATMVAFQPTTRRRHKKRRKRSSSAFAVVQQRPQPVLVVWLTSTLHSPVRLFLVGFVVLFVFLNNR